MPEILKIISIFLLGIILLAIFLFVISYFKAIRSVYNHLKNLDSRMVQTSSGLIECVITGEGYPVLVVHGAFGGFDQGLFLAQNIDMTNYQVISVSRFGYLRTPVPSDATLDTQADAYASLLDELSIQQAAVFAVSAGSTSALRFAARHPQRVSSLILLSPDAPGEEYMKLPPRFVFDVLFRSDFFYWALITLFKKKIQSTFGLVPKGTVLTPQNAVMVDKVLLGNMPPSARMDGIIFETYLYEDDFKTFLTPASRFPLSQIDTPTLVINAADDPISLPENVRVIADQMPNGHLYLVPDGGHLLFGHAEEVKAEIAGFLRKHASETQNIKPINLANSQEGGGL